MGKGTGWNLEEAYNQVAAYHNMNNRLNTDDLSVDAKRMVDFLSKCMDRVSVTDGMNPIKLDFLMQKTTWSVEKLTFIYAEIAQYFVKATKYDRFPFTDGFENDRDRNHLKLFCQKGYGHVEQLIDDLPPYLVKELMQRAGKIMNRSVGV